MAQGQKYTIPLALTNQGTRTWEKAGANPVRLSYHWLDTQGNMKAFFGFLTVLPQDMAPDGSVSLNVEVYAPWEVGDYALVMMSQF